MARTIPELIAAAFAGEPLTQAEADRIIRHGRQEDSIAEFFMRDLSPEDRAGAEGQDDTTAVMGRALHEYRALVLSNLRHCTAPQLRRLVRELLTVLRWFVELEAAAEGRARRHYRQHSQAGRRVKARQKQARGLLRTIAKLKAERPVVATDAAAAKRYLRDHDPSRLPLIEVSPSPEDRTILFRRHG